MVSILSGEATHGRIPHHSKLRHYLRRLSERGGEANRRRYHTLPKTIHPWYGGEERRVPFWPPHATKRRQRPVYVRIEIRAPSEEEIEQIVAPQIEDIKIAPSE